MCVVRGDKTNKKRENSFFVSPKSNLNVRYIKHINTHKIIKKYDDCMNNRNGNHEKCNEKAMKAQAGTYDTTQDRTDL